MENYHHSNRSPSESIKIPDNKVSLSDVLGIIEKERTKSSENIVDTIFPLVGENSDTLLYVVNMEKGGWRIYSSDKRTPAIVAEGDSGYFSIEEGSPAVEFWLDEIKQNMAQIAQSTDEELTFSKDEIMFNKSLWTGESVSEVSPKVAPSYPPGHWEEIITSSTVEVHDSIEHMVPKWDQDDPYNKCCPYYSNMQDRAATGCVAIAGSQVLLYLHDKLGVPSEMFSDCSCVGTVDAFSKEFSNPSTGVWSSMSYEYQYPSDTTFLPEAVLISYVGDRVNMHYCENILGSYSWAVPKNLKSDLFEYYGITCYHGDYDEGIVKSNLSKKLPVIVSASDQAIPVNGDIHCFVIDGYRRTRIKYNHYHYYVLDGTPEGQYAMPKEYTTYSYSQPVIESIKINWGWRSQWKKPRVNDGWYALTEGWTVTNGRTFDYNHHVKMIYGFSVSNK